MSSALTDSNAPITNLTQVLINKYTDEEQSLKIVSEKLQPSQSSNNMVVFELPKKGTVLDSNSAFIVKVNWSGYDATEDDVETITGKVWSGVLGCLEKCQLLVDGKVVLFQENLGRKLWLEHRFQNPDQISEIGDIQHGGNNAVFVKQSYDTTQVNTYGKVSLKRTSNNTKTTANKQFNNKVGSGELAFDLHLPLHSILPALKDLQLPVNLLGQMRLELFYNTKFEDVFTIANDDTSSFQIGATPTVLAKGTGYAVGETFEITSADATVNATGKVLTETGGAVDTVEITSRGSGFKTGTATTLDASASGDNALTLTIAGADLKQAIPESRKTVSFSSPFLLLDYLVYDDPMFENALRNTMNTTGIILPMRHCAIVKATLPAITGTGSFVDTNLQMSGKALMKVYAVHRYANNINSADNEGKALVSWCGKNRSDALENLETNLLVNSLLIQDRNINTRTKAYHSLNETGENMAFCPPATLETNLTMGGANADSDELDPDAVVGGTSVNAYPNEWNMRDALQGSLYISAFDLSKYPQGGDTLSNAGFRVGATPVIFRSKRDASTVFTQQAVECEFFIEYLRVMDIRSQVVDVRDQ